MGTLYNDVPRKCNDVARGRQLTNSHARARDLIYSLSSVFRTGWVTKRPTLVVGVAFTTISVTDF